LLIRVYFKSPLPSHLLALVLIATGFIGVFLHIINRRRRRTLLLASPPGSIAGVISLTSRSGFGELLLPYDDERALEDKLEGLRFRLDKRTGAILADPDPDAYGTVSLLGGSKGKDEMYDLEEPSTAHSSTFLAYQAASGVLPWERSWDPSAPLRSPGVSKTAYVP